MTEDEKIIRRAVKKGLSVNVNGKEHHYRITMSGKIKYLDGRYIIDVHRKDYLDVDIYIDCQKITIYTHKDWKPCYLHYYHYEGDSCFEGGQKIIYDLYLSVNDVLNGLNFYTTTKEERRRVKLEKLKNMICVKGV